MPYIDRIDKTTIQAYIRWKTEDYKKDCIRQKANNLYIIDKRMAKNLKFVVRKG